MGTKFTQNQKQKAIDRYFSGDTVKDISDDIGISQSTFYSWINKYKNRTAFKDIKLRDFSTTKKQAIRLDEMVGVLRNVCVDYLSLQERLYIVETLSNEHTVNFLCEALGAAKGTYYNHTLRNKRENTQFNIKQNMLKPIIRDIYDQNHQIFGPTKITALLHKQGYSVSLSTVSKLMYEMELYSIRNGAKSYYENSKRKKRENILKRDFNANKPNKVWVSDVTQFTVKNMKFFICVIIDIFSRKVVAYHVSKNNSTHLAKTTFKKAFEARQPEEHLIFHTDNGSNYISATFMNYLKELCVNQSFSNVHNPYDNSVCESFFNNLKREELYRYKYPTIEEFKRSLDKYISFYNDKRPHASLRYKTPTDFEADYCDK